MKLLAAAAAILACLPAAALAEPSAGERPPAIAAQDLTGKAQTLEQYRGKIVVLHFWATWCPYCRGEIPKLVEIALGRAGSDVQVLAVSVDERVPDLRAFAAHYQLPYPILPDPQASLADRYQVGGVPVTFLIAPDGRIARVFHGSADLFGAIARLRDAQSLRAP